MAKKDLKSDVKQVRRGLPRDPKTGKIKAGPGRPKGLKNKHTMAMQEMVQTAMDLAGERIQMDLRAMQEVDPENISAQDAIILQVPAGAAYLLKQAENNPAQFLTLAKQLMPAKLDIEVTLQADDLIGLVAERRDALHARKMQLIEGTATEVDDDE